MKTSNGFILLNQLLICLVSLLLLTSALLAYTRSLKLYQKSLLLENAASSAQLLLANVETATTYNLTTSKNYPFKEVQVTDDKTIIFNLIIFEP